MMFSPFLFMLWEKRRFVESKSLCSMLYADQVFYSIQWTLGAIRQTPRFFSSVSSMIRIQFSFYISICQFCEKMQFLQVWHCLPLFSLRDRVRPMNFLFQAKLDSWVCAGSFHKEHYSPTQISANKFQNRFKIRGVWPESGVWVKHHFREPFKNGLADFVR